MAIHSFALMNQPPFVKPGQGLLGNGIFNLGGLSGGTPAIRGGLLGNNYDPAEMRRLQIKRGLLGMGAAILANGKGTAGEVIGQGLEGGLQGADQAQQDYLAQAQLQQKMQIEAEQRQKEAEQRKAQSDYIASLPPAQQNLAKAFPTQFGAQAAQTAFPDPAKPTTEMQNYNYGQKDPGFNTWLTNDKKAGATNVTVGGGKYGTIPPGYELKETPTGAQLVPIPGGEPATAAAEAKAVTAAQGSKKSTLTDTVVGAASKARKLIGLNTTGVGGQILSNVGPSDAAELYRQAAVLKANAKIENLNAMRRESKTGGALGSVSEAENAMLGEAAGALDPAAGPERFSTALDNYELTLLRIVHGYEAGTKIYEQTRDENIPAKTPQPGNGRGPVTGKTSSGISWSAQ